MTKDDLDMRIKIGTDYNNSGAKQAKADLQDLSNAAASPMQSSGKAAAEEQQRSAALAAQMELETKTRRELQAEIKRLTAAFKEQIRGSRMTTRTASFNPRLREGGDKLVDDVGGGDGVSTHASVKEAT